MSFSPSRFGTVNMHTKVFNLLLRKYFDLFDWTRKKQIRIVDIGTGPGSTLFNLIPLLPQNYKEIVCTDLEEEMIIYFNSLPKDHRISSRHLNIQTENLPHDLTDRFDFALSTNTFMYLDNHRRVFKNIHKMLKSGGELFCVWSKKCDLFDFYKALSKIDKWYPYTSDFRNWNTYFDNEFPTSTIEIELKHAELEVLKLEELSDNVFDSENEQTFLDIYDSLDFISKRIPKYDLLNYKKHFHSLVKTRLIWDSHAEFGHQTKHPFPFLVVAAKKK